MAGCGTSSEGEVVVHRAIGLVAIGIIGAAAVTGCSNNSESSNPASLVSAEPGVVTTSSVPSATSTPPLPATYALTESTIDVAGLGQRISSSTGTIEITQGDGGGQVLVARGTKKKGAPVWELDLTLTNQGRASGGKLLYAARTWNVTPGTGDIRIERLAPTGEPSRFRLVSVGAITMTEVPTPTVNTPLVLTLVGTAPPTS